ncbi:MAG: hypothetical protein MJZ34_02820 [Paludibacteraceae bacterium]|nr:hypothetical protein [Paludibacteraceae bacterium]
MKRNFSEEAEIKVVSDWVVDNPELAQAIVEDVETLDVVPTNEENEGILGWIKENPIKFGAIATGILGVGVAALVPSFRNKIAESAQKLLPKAKEAAAEAEAVAAEASKTTSTVAPEASKLSPFEKWLEEEKKARGLAHNFAACDALAQKLTQDWFICEPQCQPLIAEQLKAACVPCDTFEPALRCNRFQYDGDAPVSHKELEALDRIQGFVEDLRKEATAGNLPGIIMVSEKKAFAKKQVLRKFLKNFALDMEDLGTPEDIMEAEEADVDLMKPEMYQEVAEAAENGTLPEGLVAPSSMDPAEMGHAYDEVMDSTIADDDVGIEQEDMSNYDAEQGELSLSAAPAGDAMARINSEAIISDDIMVQNFANMSETAKNAFKWLRDAQFGKMIEKAGAPLKEAEAKVAKADELFKNNAENIADAIKEAKSITKKNSKLSNADILDKAYKSADKNIQEFKNLVNADQLYQASEKGLQKAVEEADAIRPGVEEAVKNANKIADNVTKAEVGAIGAGAIGGLGYGGYSLYDALKDNSEELSAEEPMYSEEEPAVEESAEEVIAPVQPIMADEAAAQNFSRSLHRKQAASQNFSAKKPVVTTKGLSRLLGDKYIK